ncbi:hypothetical protein E5F05_13865 [Deinococcus metallilatus]|uniref:Uncharacterized protein n=1 Tax=Deinococcus metallilatus TaxID=1211322 RepID=A0AAJ5F371_9DEIO|nr:hypothetical protein [Deinococcus metallilatus]MBB5294154.1 hypothetical protein [Deinococcus metallilatus]QBY08936.1 hypothetical protein E5F05_13865 [Deinococcus metallilatus]RXJ10080.1 hypothetical protein ERJ73_12695 [Deinococcus metallilatus]TLK27983.1 hypothetical protein FCS05_08685 [Deinococcus metallilatus]GMA16509.1 hypothetical protein GCM10025871_28400 [Deinococcus metallilatus]
MMNGSGTYRSSSSLSLEAKVASQLSVYLEETSVDSEFKVEPSADLSYLLELYIPQLLSHSYSEWERESLDGVFLTSARKTGLGTAELIGMCILISDQTVTPFFIRLVLASSRDSVASYQVLLGEPGGGRLGISGPPCKSPDAQRLLETVGTRLNNIRWSYATTSDTN